jgi:hypothetical protein
MIVRLSVEQRRASSYFPVGATGRTETRGGVETRGGDCRGVVPDVDHLQRMK